MKKIFFVFAMVFALSSILTGISGSAAFARCIDWPDCGPQDPPPPPPPPPPPLPSISFSNINFGCSFSGDVKIDMVLSADITGASSITSSAILIDRVLRRTIPLTSFVIDSELVFAIGSLDGYFSWPLTLEVTLNAPGFATTKITKDFSGDVCSR